MKIFIKIGYFLSEICRLFVDLITDKAKDNGNIRKLSLGRVCFLILFVVSIHIWLGGTDIASNMLIIMSALLTYVFGTKITSTMKVLKGKDTDIVITNPEDHGD